MSTKEEKLAKFKELRAKKDAAQLQAGTHGSSGGSSGGKIGSGTMKVEVLAPPFSFEGATAVTARVISSACAKIPFVDQAPFQIAPLMTETGGYKTNSDKSRKPVEIAEYGVLTVKMKDAPKITGWATPPDLFPGAIIDVKNVPAIGDQYKVGACVIGSFV